MIGDLLKGIAPLAVPAMFGLAGLPAILAGSATGALIAKASNEDVLTGAALGGLGGYQGAGIGQSMKDVAASNLIQAGGPGAVTGETTASLLARQGTVAPTISEGIKATINDPKQFLANMGGGDAFKGGIRTASALAAPVGRSMLPEYNANPDDDPMAKYDPKRRLNLNQPTGIRNAMMRDSGLRLNQPFMQFNEGGYLETGMGDGMSDSIRTSIDGEQPAALSENEFVIPADVVSGLGNGSSDAGAEKLYAMMDRVRKARTGNEEQAPEINAERMMQV